MNSSDEFARELFEDAKHCLRQAKMASTEISTQRNLRHGLIAAFSFLELQIETIAQHFSNSEFFSIHERGIINQRDVVFEKGYFRLKETTKYSRLSDRMFLLQHKFKGEKLTERGWWSPLLEATERRNEIAHPRSAVTLLEQDVDADLLAVLQCASDLFKIVFGKNLPYAAHGLKPKGSGGI